MNDGTYLEIPVHNGREACCATVRHGSGRLFMCTLLVGHLGDHENPAHTVRWPRRTIDGFVICSLCDIPIEHARWVDHFHDHAVLKEKS